MAKTLNGAYKELAKQICGNVVAKVGFEIGERVVAYAAAFSKDGHVQLMRHDNYRKDLKECHYCEVLNEYDFDDNKCPNDLLAEMWGELQFDYKMYIK